MKTIKIIILALTLVSLRVSAQDNVTDLRNRCLFGIKAGGNYSNVYDTRDQNFHTDPKIGLATGVFLAIPFGTWFGIQPELLFSQKGFKGKGSVLGADYNLTRTT